MLPDAEVENVARSLFKKNSERKENPNRVQLRRDLRQSAPELDDKDRDRVIVEIFKLIGDEHRNRQNNQSLISPVEPRRGHRPLTYIERNELRKRIHSYLKEHPQSRINKAFNDLKPDISYPGFARYFHEVRGCLTPE
jgi:hypothetical protein